MSLPDNTIRHLSHSSFLFKINGLTLIFDYAPDSGKIETHGNLETGFIRPEALAGEEVYVFASHSHGDHFHPVIFSWEARAGRIHFILAYDIPNPPTKALVFRPGEEKTVGNLRVRAYPSTDAGLAYSIYTGDRHIYFSGDNAFWNWDGDLDDEIYQRTALDAIDGQTPMDIAFQVCDPRLDGMGDGGIHIFARTFQPKLLVPIHAFGNYAFNAIAEKRLRAGGFANAFWCVKHQGETLQFKPRAIRQVQSKGAPEN